MPEFDVEVEGRKRRRRREPGKGPSSWLSALLRRVLRQPALLVVGALILFVWLIGTPHVGGPYTCNGSLREGGGCGSYDSCTFYGVQGRRIVFPEPGEQCQIFRFMPIKWDDTTAGRDRAVDAFPLNDSNISPLHWGVIAGTCALGNFPSPRERCNRLLDVLLSEEYTVIECIYGPINNDGTGWRIHDFWKDKAPREMASFETPDEEHPFLILGRNFVRSCPEDSRAARITFENGRI